MKKGKLFKIVFLLFVCFWAILPVSAAEMWEGRPQRWDIFVNGAYQTISCDYSRIPSSHPCYGTIYSAVTRFNNTSPSSVRANYSSISVSANVFHQVTSQNYWNQIAHVRWAYGFTVPTDENGRKYYDREDFYAQDAPSVINIKRADIYYNPNTSNFDGKTYDFFIVLAMHELGHAYGLGHDPGTVMNDSPLPQYASGLTARDKQALQAFYGGT